MVTLPSLKLDFQENAGNSECVCVCAPVCARTHARMCIFISVDQRGGKNMEEYVGRFYGPKQEVTHAIRAHVLMVRAWLCHLTSPNYKDIWETRSY